MNSAVEQGRQARRDGVSLANNKHANGTVVHIWWRMGWHEQDRFIKSLEPPTTPTQWKEFMSHV
jgi:hypothetical protein